MSYCNCVIVTSEGPAPVPDNMEVREAEHLPGLSFYTPHCTCVHSTGIIRVLSLELLRCLVYFIRTAFNRVCRGPGQRLELSSVAFIVS